MDRLMIENLLEQAFQQYGLMGLVVAFAVLGPGFTYVRTKNSRLQAEVQAQALLNEFARREQEQSERLEERLTSTLERLDQSKDEVFHLRLALNQTQHDLHEMREVCQKVDALTERVVELEAQLDRKRQRIQELEQAMKAKGQDIIDE